MHRKFSANQFFQAAQRQFSRAITCPWKTTRTQMLLQYILQSVAVEAIRTDDAPVMYCMSHLP